MAQACENHPCMIKCSNNIYFTIFKKLVNILSNKEQIKYAFKKKILPSFCVKIIFTSIFEEITSINKQKKITVC